MGFRTSRRAGRAAQRTKWSPEPPTASKLAAEDPERGDGDSRLYTVFRQAKLYEVGVEAAAELLTAAICLGRRVAAGTAVGGGGELRPTREGEVGR